MRTILPIAAAALLLSACADSPVQPEAFDAPEASFAKDWSGGGNNEFFVGQGWSMKAADGRGYRCTAFADGDASDFIRRDSDGSDFVHFTDEAATMRIWKDDVLIYDGTGRANASWYYEDGYGSGLGEGTARALAHFDNPDGPGKKKALCSLKAPRAGFAFAIISVW